MSQPSPALDLLHPAAAHARGDRPVRATPGSGKWALTTLVGRRLAAQPAGDASSCCGRRPLAASAHAAQAAGDLHRQPRLDAARDARALGGPGRQPATPRSTRPTTGSARRSISTGTSSSATRSTTPA